MKLISRLAIVAVLVLTLGACEVAKTNTASNEVVIDGYSFSPQNRTVSAGTTVTWTNKEIITHSVLSNNGIFDSGNLSTNNSFSRQFNTTGTFSYHCGLHPSMTGTIIVN